MICVTVKVNVNDFTNSNMSINAFKPVDKRRNAFSVLRRSNQENKMRCK